MNSTTAATCVFPSPSKIPYGGFSPVRLQTEIKPQPSSSLPGLSAARIHPATTLIGGQRPDIQPMRPTEGLTVGGTGAPAPSGTLICGTGRFRPEALGSSAGYAVPPGPRLLWPHPSLSTPPADLCIRRRVLLSIGRIGRGSRGSPIYLFLRAVLRTPVDRTGAIGCTSPSTLAFATFVLARHPQVHTRRFWCGRLTRLQGSRKATARRIARPAPTRAFTFELSPSGSLQYRRRT